MTHAEGSLDTADGDSLYWQCWSPAGSPGAVLLLVHGLAEHSGRYAHFADFFVRRDYAVIALDHKGHGRSGGRRCHVRGFSDFTGALQLLSDKARRDHPRVPLFLVGHSMGGLIALHFLFEHQSAFEGCILSGAAVMPTVDLSPIQRVMMRCCSRLLPGLRLMQLESSAISRDGEVVERYRNDPLVHSGKVTSRLAEQLFTAMEGLAGRLESIRLPMLILHGGSDGLTSPEGSRMVYRNISSDDKKLIVYDGLYHEVYNEPEQEAVMSDVADWIARRLVAAGGRT